MGLLGMIRSISPILRVIMGLGMMFILPYLWMIIIGLLMIDSISPSYYGLGYGNPQDLMGSYMLYMIIDYGGAMIIFIVGIVMTISGVMDWWRAKQDS
jgi:hypothetical protein